MKSKNKIDNLISPTKRNETDKLPQNKNRENVNPKNNYPQISIIIEKCNLDFNNYTKILPFRIKEYLFIYNYINKGIKSKGTYKPLCIIGPHGTGKTECIKNVFSELQKDSRQLLNTPKFHTIYFSRNDYKNIDNMLLEKLYNCIFLEITYKNTLNDLDKYFKCLDKKANFANLKDPTIRNIVIVLDNAEYLYQKSQKTFHTLLSWNSYENSKMILILISHYSYFFKELPNKIKNLIGDNNIKFQMYSKDELYEIIKLKYNDNFLFTEEALKESCVKSFEFNWNIIGLFKMLKYTEKKFKSMGIDHTKIKITKDFVIKTSNDYYNSIIKKRISGLKIYEKLVLGILLLKFEDKSIDHIKVHDLYELIFDIFDEYNNSFSGSKLILKLADYNKIIIRLIKLNLISLLDYSFPYLRENFILKQYPIDLFNMAIEENIDINYLFKRLIRIFNKVD